MNKSQTQTVLFDDLERYECFRFVGDRIAYRKLSASTYCRVSNEAMVHDGTMSWRDITRPIKYAVYGNQSNVERLSPEQIQFHR